MENKKIIMIAGLILSISTIIFISKNDTSSLIGTYIDGEYSSTIPDKNDGYVVENIACDNGATGKWDYSEWGILTTNMTKKSKCNIYFKKGIRIADVNTYVDDTGKCPTVNSDGTVNVTGAESENSLLCSAPDNYGTSYYFRGNVQNNYVKFANFYWRIVRINGDGSIRLIYDGTSAHQNGEASEDRIIGNSIFNKLGDDNAYVGYMYGTPGSSTYEETHANINGSTIKSYIDTWYENNLKGTVNEQYVADNMFCNRRELRIGIGYSKNITYYNGYYIIKLKCQKSDSFTVNDSINGNSSLIYPIGLITAEEIKISLEESGVDWSNGFFYTGYSYWTMSPVYFGVNNAKYAKVTDVTDSGSPYGSGGAGVNLYDGGVKPVINLKPNSLKSGDGTINNPYTVE